MKYKWTRGVTNRIVRCKIRDATGAPLTGLTSASAGLLCYYLIEGAASAVSVPLVVGTVGTHIDGGFIAVPNLVAVYEFGIPNLALASGKAVFCQLYGATNQDPYDIEVELDSVNYQDAAAFGLTNLDVTVGSRLGATDKSGFKLAADGADAISTADPGSAANVNTWPKMAVWLFRRWAKKTNLANGLLHCFADDGTTVNTTQVATDDGTTQTQGPIT